MRILAFDHNAIWREYRRRYRELCRLEEVDVTVVAPNYLDLPFRRESFQAKERGEEFDLFTAKPLGTFKSHRGWLHPLEVIRHIRRIRPDILYVDAEPEAWYTSEIIFLKNRLRSSAKIVLSTFSNLNLFQSGFPYKPPFIYRVNYSYSLRQAAGIFCYTSESEVILRANGFKGRAAKINWGVDLDKFRRTDPGDLKKKLNLGLGSFVVGYCGRMVEEKGLLCLVEAAAMLDKNKICLLLIGDGPLKKKISSLSRRYGVDTRIIGTVDNSLLPAYYCAMDIFVLPSLTTRYWKEQFGRVLIEAMACEVPVIGSSSGEIPHVVGDAGIVFEEGRSGELARRIERLEKDPALRLELGRLGRQRAEERFAWRNIASRIFNFWKNL